MLAAWRPGGGYGALPDPVVTVLDPGEGAENDVPLDPLRLGSWGEAAAGLYRVVGPIDVGRDTVIAAEAYGSVRLLRQNDGDIVLHGVDEPLDPDRLSVLWLPERVHVGMRWVSELEDRPVEGLGLRPEALEVLVGAQGAPVVSEVAPLGAWTALIDGEPALVHLSEWENEGGSSEWSTFCHPLNAAGDTSSCTARCWASLEALREERAAVLGVPGTKHLRTLRELPLDVTHAWREDGQVRALAEYDPWPSGRGGRSLRVLGGEADAPVTDAALARGLFRGGRSP